MKCKGKLTLGARYNYPLPLLVEDVGVSLVPCREGPPIINPVTCKYSHSMSTYVRVDVVFYRLR